MLYKTNCSSDRILYGTHIKQIPEQNLRQNVLNNAYKEKVLSNRARNKIDVYKLKTTSVSNSILRYLRLLTRTCWKGLESSRTGQRGFSKDCGILNNNSQQCGRFASSLDLEGNYTPLFFCCLSKSFFLLLVVFLRDSTVLWWQCCHYIQ